MYNAGQGRGDHAFREIEMTSKDFTLRDDPFALFAEWLKEAEDTEPNDPTAMALASVDENGLPDVRMILLKGHDERGFVFYTNIESAKGRELSAQAKAAAVFHWKSLRRQVRVRGPVSRVTDAEADAYFNSRHLQSRLGACASDQSRPLKDRATLETRVKEIAARYPDGKVPRPSHWSGYRIVPVAIEFWQDGAFRLHDRVQFTRAAAGDPWKRQRLYP
jgi:pyridoxamine 5'-phosphate oxidase